MNTISYIISTQWTLDSYIETASLKIISFNLYGCTLEGCAYNVVRISKTCTEVDISTVI